MIRQRPGAVTAAGVLSIIYGSLFTLCGLCGVIGLFLQNMDMGALFGGPPGQAEMQKRIQEELQKALEREVPAHNVIQIVSAIIGLGLPVAFLITGIGLVRMALWSRSMGIWLCALAIFTTILQAIYQLAFVMPATRNAFQAAIPAAVGPGAAEVARAMQGMMTIIATLTVIVFVVIIFYFVTIVVLLSRPHVREAFAAAARGDFDRPAPDEYDDRERIRPQPRDEGDDDWRYRPPPESTPPGGPPDERIR